HLRRLRTRRGITSESQLHRTAREQKQHSENGDSQEPHTVSGGRGFKRRLRRALVRKDCAWTQGSHSPPFCSCGCGAGRRRAISASGRAALSLPTTYPRRSALSSSIRAGLSCSAISARNSRTRASRSAISLLRRCTLVSL